MGISICESKITDELITAYMMHRRGPTGDLIWQDHFQELVDILIKHKIVSPSIEWIKITYDPATWPPLGESVWTRSDLDEVEVLVRREDELNEQEVYCWMRPQELYFATNNKFEYVSLCRADVNIVYWKSIL